MMQKVSEMMVKAVEKITRERLRTLRDGETLTTRCANGYDLDSQKNTAYAMGKMENCRFSCKCEGLQLSVTRYGID